MKKLINVTALTLVALFSASSFAGRHCSDDDTVMYAKTLNHKKEVEVCKAGERFRYTFGKVDSTPDIVLERTYSEIHVNNMQYQHSVEIYNGNIMYDIGWGGGFETEVEYAITVSKNNKQISKIKLDPETMVENTMKYATQD